MVATLKDINLEDIDPNLRAVVEAVREGEARRDKAINNLLAEIGDGAVIAEVKSAVDALDADMETMNKSFTEKLAELRRRNVLGNTPYGPFASQQDARGFGLLVMAEVWGRKSAQEAFKRDFAELAERDMASNPDSAGGALIPDEYANILIRLVEQHGLIEGKALKIPMGSDKIVFNRRTGGVTVYIGAENVAATESQPTFANIVLEPQEWLAYTEIPNTLSEDAAADIGMLVMEEMAWAFAKKVDDTALSGDGTSIYGGIKGLRASLIDINGVDDGGGLVIASGNAWSEITNDDILKLQGQLPQYQNSVDDEMFCSKPFFFQVLARIAQDAGGITAAEIEGQRRLLHNGAVVNLSPSMPKTQANSHIPLLYGSVRDTVAMGTRRGLTFSQSRDYKFAERQLALLGSRRLAMSIHSLGTATEAGAMVGLITAAG